MTQTEQHKQLPRRADRRSIASGNFDGTRWRGKLPIPPHAHPLVRKLVELANAEMTTMQEIGVRAGLHPNTISRWRTHSTPRLVDYVAALNALGYEIVIRERRS